MLFFFQGYTKRMATIELNTAMKLLVNNHEFQF